MFNMRSVGAFVAGAVISASALFVYSASANPPSALVPDPNVHPSAIHNGNCPWYSTDPNHDCKHNSADLGIVVSQYQVDVPTNTPVAATNTPTSTPVPPTNTATAVPPTATNTAAPTGAYTVSQLIADTTGDNDGTLCPPVNTYNWGIEGHGLYGEPPEGDQITGWGTAQWISCGASAPGVTLQIQNYKMYGWTGSQWITYSGNYNNWCATTDPNTTSNYQSCTSSGGGWAMPTGQKAIHWASNRVADQNVQCVVVVYEARSTGSAPIMVNAGADHISGGSILGDMFISKYKRINTTGWTPIGGSSCSVSTLNAHHPPGM